MAGAVGLRDVRYEAKETHFRAKNTSARPTRSSSPRTNRTPISPTIRRNASSARAACAPARKCRAPFALTIEGRGFDSRVKAGREDDDNFLTSDCVSCGACVQACPTGTLQEKSIIEIGTPERSVITTCAYCGVGCSFKAEMRGDELVRMVPYKHGKANRGHSCVKGRFAYGYASHKDRILNPMIRDSINDPWKEVSWAEAMEFAATRMKGIIAKHGREVGGRDHLQPLHQ